MDECIKRETAIKIVSELGYSRNDMLYFLKTLPAIVIPNNDVRPIVFCKDCRHRDPEDHKCDCGQPERQGCPFKVADDYFCAYGEK